MCSMLSSEELRESRVTCACDPDMRRPSPAETGDSAVSGEGAGEAGDGDKSDRDFFFHHVPPIFLPFEFCTMYIF